MKKPVKNAPKMPMKPVKGKEKDGCCPTCGAKRK